MPEIGLLCGRSTVGILDFETTGSSFVTRPPHFIFATNKHGDYCIPAEAAHRPAAQCVLNGAVWESDTIEFILTHCGEGDILHAGAFFGDALPALSKATRGTVWAFEPNPQSFRAAQITALMNDLKNVKLMNCALGARQEQRKLVVRRSPPMARPPRPSSGLSNCVCRDAE